MPVGIPDRGSGQSIVLPMNMCARHRPGSIATLQLCQGVNEMAARLMARGTGDAVLVVEGRRSGRSRATNARPIAVAGQRHVVAIRVDAQWARNLRAAGKAVLLQRGRSERVTAVEVDGEELRTVFEAFLASSRYAPTRRILTEILPDPADHPVFKLVGRP